MSDSLEGVYAPLDAAQTAKVTEFLAAIADIPAPPSFIQFRAQRPVLFATKWLVSRKWVVAHAVDIYTECAAWRIAEGFETKPLFPTFVSVKGYDMDELAKFQGQGVRPTNQFIDKAYAVTKPVYAAGWHKWDKGGRPVYMERSGRIKAQALIDRLTASAAPGEPIAPWVVETHKHSNEIGAQLLKAQQRKALAEGKPFPCQASVIMDCTGMSISQFRGAVLDLIKTNSQMDQKYAPEGVYRVYIVNAPGYVTAIWAVVKLWLDAESQKKVVFAAPGEPTRKVLLENFDEEHLPAFLGGKCNCEGGCIPDVDDCPDDVSDGPQTMELVVKAGATKSYDLPVSTGAKVQCQFVTVAGGIDFAASFLPSTEDDRPIQLASSSRACKTGTPESFVTTAPADGVLIFRFDNTHSWVKSKTLRLRVTVENG